MKAEGIFERHEECGRFVIYTAEQFKYLDNQTSEFVLGADINLTQSMGSIENFSGSLDGAGFVIRGASGSLFGKLENAYIRNATIEDSRIEIANKFSAGILAKEINGGKIENIKIVNSEITASIPNNIAGGLAGKAADSSIKNISITGLCIKTTTDLPLYAVGGIVGILENSEIENAHVLNAKISANALSSGGAIGESKGGKVTKSGVKFVSVESMDYAKTVGGFAGNASGTEFTRCEAFGSIYTETALTGGFVGKLSERGRISNSFAVVNIHAYEIAGGFVGEITNASRIESSKAYGAVFGGKTAGGFAGIISAENAPNTITESLALGAVTATSAKGEAHRFAGKLKHEGINNCHAYLGMAVIIGEKLAHTTPNPYGANGGDISKAQLRNCPKIT